MGEKNSTIFHFTIEDLSKGYLQKKFHTLKESKKSTFSSVIIYSNFYIYK